jgi:hypothetical protein
MYILLKLTLDIYYMKITRIKIVNGTTVTIAKVQNNHTLNNNNKHTVEDMCRLIGLSDTVPQLMAGSNPASSPNRTGSQLSRSLKP